MTCNKHGQSAEQSQRPAVAKVLCEVDKNHTLVISQKHRRDTHFDNIQSDLNFSLVYHYQAS